MRILTKYAFIYKNIVNGDAQIRFVCGDRYEIKYRISRINFTRAFYIYIGVDTENGGEDSDASDANRDFAAPITQ